MHSNDSPKRPALTLIEVMLAMTLSLLIMLALAATFKLIGDQITKSQSDLDLSADIREVAATLRQEVRRSTLVGNTAPPVSDGRGYVVYHEGPMTSQTTSQVDLGRLDRRQQDAVDYLPSNRYGDLDDYLAFTATAPSNSPFMGYIPYGVLAAKIFQEGRKANNSFVFPGPNGAYTLADARRLVPFYSTQAEIAYWLSPDWDSNPDGTISYVNGKPVFRDRGANQDFLPDRLNLHRRVLLIRDDLNMSLSDISDANNTTAPPVNYDVLPFLLPSQQIVPMHLAWAPTLVNDSQNSVAPGVWHNKANQNASKIDAPNWLVGVARLQQIMDLSISRVVNQWDTPNAFGPASTRTGTGQPTPITGPAPPPPMLFPNSNFGMPENAVRANSLSGGENDVTRPQNRFAHVRMPNDLLINRDWLASTMPLLALSPPHEFIKNNRQPAADPSRAMPSQADPSSGADYGKFTMVGFLRPEFNLAERVVNEFGSIVDIERGGEDVIAKNVLSFDVRVFDPNAPSFVWVGPDGQEGVAGVDDNGDDESSFLSNPLLGGLSQFDPGELGWVGSDDMFLPLDDLSIRNVVQQTDFGNVPVRFRYQPVGNGAFVDLDCLRLSGSPFSGPNGIVTISNYANMGLLSPDFVGGNAQPLGTLLGFPRSLQQSGRFVIQRGGAAPLVVSSFYQAVFDTWTQSYLDDGFDQEGLSEATWVWPGTGNGTGPPIYPPGQIVSAQKEYSAFPTNYTTERLANETLTTPVSAISWSNMGQVDFGAFEDNGSLDGGRLASGPNRIDSRPPIEAPLQGIQIQLRLIDPATGQIRQQTIVEKF